MLSIWRVKQITRLVCNIIKCDGDDEAGGVRLSLCVFVFECLNMISIT